MEQAVHAQINEYRTSRNLPPLTLDSRLSAQARAHSQNMASRRVPFSHQGFDQRVRTVGRAIPYRQTAENVAFNRGVADPVRQAVQGWIDSPGHYANLTGSYDLTGVGVSRNSRGEYYFTQMFLRRR
ncbi:CAP domain-containing protein [Leptolyngbya sp. FACHB-261]|nr:CAP domain-containing protein [Leptolyngbya sp. FACHB-261]